MGLCSSNIFTNLDQRSTVTDPKISKDMRDILQAKVTTTLSSFFKKLVSLFHIWIEYNIFTIFKKPKSILDVSKIY